MSESPLPALVLAGQRHDSHPLADHFDVPLAVLVPLGGTPLVNRVVGALQRCDAIGSITLCGPAHPRHYPELAALLDAGVDWRAPGNGPSLTVASALDDVPDFPVLVTTGDHGLLDVEILDYFCAAVRASAADLVVGVASYEAVMQAFPDTRRTRIALADGAVSGCNLFAFRSPASRAVAALWRQVEAQRKRPWRVMGSIGVINVARYLAGRLTRARALAELGERTGCVIELLELPFPRAAVDVDSLDDWRLAERILAAQAGSSNSAL